MKIDFFGGVESDLGAYELRLRVAMDLFMVLYVEGALTKQDIEELCSVGGLCFDSEIFGDKKDLLEQFFADCPPLYETPGASSPFKGSILLSDVKKHPMMRNLLEMIIERVDPVYDQNQYIVGDRDSAILARYEEIRKVISVLNIFFRAGLDYPPFMPYHRDIFVDLIGNKIDDFDDRELRDFFMTILGNEKYIEEFVNELYVLTMSGMRAIKSFAMNRLCCSDDGNYENMMLVLANKLMAKHTKNDDYESVESLLNSVSSKILKTFLLHSNTHA